MRNAVDEAGRGGMVVAVALVVLGDSGARCYCCGRSLVLAARDLRIDMSDERYSWLKVPNRSVSPGSRWCFRPAPKGTRGSDVDGDLRLAEWVADVPVGEVGSRSS